MVAHPIPAGSYTVLSHPDIILYIGEGHRQLNNFGIKLFQSMPSEEFWQKLQLFGADHLPQVFGHAGRSAALVTGRTRTWKVDLLPLGCRASPEFLAPPDTRSHGAPAWQLGVPFSLLWPKLP